MDDDSGHRKSKRHSTARATEQLSRLDSCTEESFLSCRRAVEFEDVKGERVIFEYPLDSNRWYILSCAEHGLNFDKTPLRGASIHLARIHKATNSSYAEALAQFGILV